MLEIAIMLEGQNGLNWERWQRIAKAVDELGFVGLYRSDHFTNAGPPDKDSLELWVSLTWLASHTKNIEFAPLVTPLSFREPTMTARMATAIDDLSGGRFTLGLGAGWQEREHTKFGFDLLEVSPRFDRFAEGLAVISQLLNSDEPTNFEGDYYTLNEAIMLPRPRRAGGPPILIGGNGPKRTLPLVAQYAQEWNALFTTVDIFKERSALLDSLLAEQGRTSDAVKRSMMTGMAFGRNEAELEEAANQYGGSSAEKLRERGLIVGSGSEIVDQLGAWHEAGLQRIMLQWLDLDNIDGLEALAKALL